MNQNSKTEPKKNTEIDICANIMQVQILVALKFMYLNRNFSRETLMVQPLEIPPNQGPEQ